MNSTFENIFCNYFIFFNATTNSVNSFTLQNINITGNNFTYSAIYALGGIINLTIDSLEMNQNNILINPGLRIGSFSGGNVVLNRMLFLNNYVGMMFIKKLIIFTNYEQKMLICSIYLT